MVETAIHMMESGQMAKVPIQQLVEKMSLRVRGKDLDRQLPVYVWLALYRSCRTMGPNATASVAQLGAFLAGRHIVLENQEAIRADQTQAAIAFTMLETLASSETRHVFVSFINELYAAAQALWRDEEEIVLAATYQALRAGWLDHYNAASVATALLGKHFSPTAWRLRVSRWATKKGLPPVTLPRGGNRRQASTMTDTDA